MNENLNTSKQAPLKSFEDLPVEFLTNVTSVYIKDTLDLLKGLNFTNLSLDKCSQLCTYFRQSGENPALREYLLKKGVTILTSSKIPETGGYILKLGSTIFIEPFNFTAKIDEFTSKNGFSYIRRLEYNGKYFIIAFKDGEYYILYEITFNTKGDELEKIHAIDNPTGGYDIINLKTKEVTSIGFILVKFNGIKTSVRLFFDKTKYIEYDGFDFSSPKEEGDIFPIIGGEVVQTNQISLS